VIGGVGDPQPNVGYRLKGNRPLGMEVVRHTGRVEFSSALDVGRIRVL
jgi:hypothetical protein